MSRLILTPIIIALAVMSTAFTSQASPTGFRAAVRAACSIGSAHSLSRPGLSVAARRPPWLRVGCLQGGADPFVAVAIVPCGRAATGAVRGGALAASRDFAFAALALLMSGNRCAPRPPGRANLATSCGSRGR